jgi:hypothetical protein
MMTQNPSDVLEKPKRKYNRKSIEKKELPKDLIGSTDNSPVPSDSEFKKPEFEVAPPLTNVKLPKRKTKPEEVPPMPKRRGQSSYNDFVREQMKLDEFKNMPNKERLGSIAKKWQTQKSKSKN